MKILTLLAVVVGFASCGSNPTSITSTDSISNNSDKKTKNQITNLCFQRLEGTSSQDSSTLNLVLKGDLVDGQFNHIPYEKDSRKGTIKGTKSGNHIKALWTFMQEGMNDTLSVEFKLSGNELLQKTFGIDKSTGRQKLTDTSTYSIRYYKIDCP